MTLGGGFGRVARKIGLAIDNLRSVDIIGADGKLRHASADDNPDLFWAVRGGGGNFGVVTTFEFGLHPMTRDVIGGGIAFPLSQARQILRFFADYVPEAPRELYLDCGIASRPGVGDSVWMDLCYSGPENQAEKWLAPIRKAGDPIVDNIGPIDYVALQKSTDISDPRARGMYLKSGFTTEVTQDAIEDVLAGFEPNPGRAMTVVWAHAGGAIGDVAADATAFPHRYAKHDLLALLDWPVESDPAEHVAYLKSYWSTLEPHTHGFYTNDLLYHSGGEVHANYQGNYERLVEVKNRYDPTNLFRLNANVQPRA